MKSTRDQDVATSLVSLGLLANRLTWFLVGGRADVPLFIADEAAFEQWKTVLQDTIDFIQSPKVSAQPRLLSRAEYLEQIYTAAPEPNKRTLKALSSYLRKIYDAIDHVSKGETLDQAKQKQLLTFAESLTTESIREVSRFHQESHIRRTSTPPLEATQHA